METRTRRTIFSVLFALLVIAVAVTLSFMLGTKHEKTYTGAQIVQIGQVE